MNRPRIADWQLPAGVTRSMWDYAHADHIADDYDGYFAYNSLFDYDRDVVLDELREPGVVLDLGCGTGRLLVPLAERGHTCVGVDLSLPMLRVVGEKARAGNLPIHRVQANLAELRCFRPASIDYALLMFSTLGMIRGSRDRQQVLGHVRQLLKPGGRLVIHVHNRWYSWFDPQGRRWLARSWLTNRFRGLEPGDRVFEYRGIPNMCLHTFTLGELQRLLRRAGFRVRRLISLDTQRQRPLARAWLLGRVRANGWIAICE
ncbi:MAG: class I SAM-dependent methyltransferase [Pirellulales bacterium]